MQNVEAYEFNSYIIKLNDNKQKITAYLENSNIKFHSSISFPNYLKRDLNSFLSKDQLLLIESLADYITIHNDDVEQLESTINNLQSYFKNIVVFPNYIYRINKDNPNDSLFNKQWYINAVNAERKWNEFTGKNIIIGLIDTGIDFEHPDLKNNLWINKLEDLNGNGTFEPWSHLESRDGVTGDFDGNDNDGNGFADDVIGYDFVNQSVVNIGDYSTPDPIPEDQGEHGTLVAGVIGAQRNNKIGIAGLAPNAKILTSKAFDITGNAESDDIARAILYAVLNGAKVLNFSFGERSESPIVYDAIKFAYSMGCVMIASSGNNGWQFEHYPSDHPEVISVGGIDESLRRSGKANYGSLLDITAPSVNIITTDVGGQFKLTGGTSLSAPIISALAALMLERNPNLTPSEIRANIQMSAQRINHTVWDVNYGAGIADFSKTLESEGSSSFEITSPYHEQTFNKSKSQFISVIGTSSSTLFDSYDIAIGPGILPQNWSFISNRSYNQVLNSELGVIDISNFTDSIYTISLRVYQKNQNVIERRIYINITSDQSKVKLNHFAAIDAYYNDKRVVLVTAATDRKCKLVLKYQKAGSEDYLTTRQIDFNSKTHSILLDESIESGVQYTGEAYFFTNELDTLIHKFDFSKKQDLFATTGFLRKGYSIPRSYVLNQVMDLYGNGTEHIAVNDLSNLYIGDTHIYEFSNNSFRMRDSSSEGWIPAGYGDSNGDNIPEIFGTSDGRSTIKQRKSTDSSPFESELYRSPIDSVFWAEKIFDIDKDGIDELIGFKYDFDNGNYYTIYKYSDGKYQQKARAILPPNLKNISLTRNSAIADFDNDGKYELVFANQRGNLFIYEFSDGKLSLEYIDSLSKSSSTQFIESPDIDGDGIPEIMHSFAGTSITTGQIESGTPLWTVRLIKSESPNNYQPEFWSENVYGVRTGTTRQGVFFRNGSSSGDLNGDNKDEIVLSFFPNLYIWKYDNLQKKMTPFWYYPTTFSNSAIIHDFDKNGVKELGVSTFGNTAFFEFDNSISGPGVPLNFDGWAESSTSAYLKWDSHPQAKEYVLFMIDFQTNPPQAREVARTSGNELLITSLNPNSIYNFSIASYNNEYSTNIGDFSDVVTVYTYPLSKPQMVENITQNSLILNFEGRLKGNHILPEYFTINNSGGLKFDIASAVLLSPNSLLLSYESLLSEGEYTLHIKSFRDFFNNYTSDTTIQFTVISNTITDELFLKKLQVLDIGLIRLEFSENILIEGAQNFENYFLSPVGRVINAELDPTDSKFVLVNLSPEIRRDGARGANYTITAKNIISESGKPITTGPGNTLGFVMSKENLRDVYVYPQPIRLSDEPTIYFGNLTPRATVNILTLDGQEIIILQESDGNGGVEWNGKDRNGNYLRTGIYIFRVRGTNSEGLEVFEEQGKFAIVP